MADIVGWDIGGVNTKAALVRDGRLVAVLQQPYELQRAPEQLSGNLRRLTSELGATAPRHAVTMTAELSQMFRTKREGVAFVLDGIVSAFPSDPVSVYTVDGDFVGLAEARAEPLRIAAANWRATAELVAQSHPDAFLIDVGTTTTDIIPIVGGAVRAEGLNDPARLATGELVYTGARRTPVEAVVAHVPYRGEQAGVSAEGFALVGDAHLWRGSIGESDYSAPTPDGRPATRAFAGERLARVICADREMLADDGVDAIAAVIADAQVRQIAEALGRVRSRHTAVGRAVVTGTGAFIAADAAATAGLDVVRLSDALGADGARCAPAAAVALLWSRRTRETLPDRTPTRSPHGIGAVIKIGGGLLADEHELYRVLEVVARATALRAVVVPGGGVFADTVRDVDGRIGLSDSVAHWAAVLAMDQYAHVLVSRLPGAVLVEKASDIAVVFDSGRIPVLAPYQWLRSRDPLPHSWDVTSDSIAAWVAGQLGAPRLLLVKPTQARAPLVDPYLDSAVAPYATKVVPVCGADELAAALSREFSTTADR